MYYLNRSLSRHRWLVRRDRRGIRVKLRYQGLPQNLWAEWRIGSPSSDPQRARVLAAVKARRSTPPPLRGADGLDAGSAHAGPGSCGSPERGVGGLRSVRGTSGYKALASLGTRLPRTVGPGRQPAARVLRCAAVLRMTAATDRAGGPCGPAGRLALDPLAASATPGRRSVVAENRRKRPRTRRRGFERRRRLQTHGASCSHRGLPSRPTRRRSRRPHRRRRPVPNHRTHPVPESATIWCWSTQVTRKENGSRVEGRRVAGRGSVAHPVLSQPGRRPIPVGTFPLPALRTRRADFRHLMLSNT